MDTGYYRDKSQTINVKIFSHISNLPTWSVSLWEYTTVAGRDLINPQIEPI